MIMILSCNRAKEKVNSVVTKTKEEIHKVKDEIIDYTKPQPPKESFETRTGLKVTDTIFNIIENDTYFPHEGEYSLVFSTTSKQINYWITNESPWGKEWKDGPIPHHIMNCNFGLGGVGMYIRTDSNGKVDTVYTNKNKIYWFLTEKNFKYVSEEFCCPNDSNLRYHNGRLLILEIDSNKVWYSNWDY